MTRRAAAQRLSVLGIQFDTSRQLQGTLLQHIAHPSPSPSPSAWEMNQQTSIHGVRGLIRRGDGVPLLEDAASKQEQCPRHKDQQAGDGHDCPDNDCAVAKQQTNGAVSTKHDDAEQATCARSSAYIAQMTSAPPSPLQGRSGSRLTQGRPGNHSAS